MTLVKKLVADLEIFINFRLLEGMMIKIQYLVDTLVTSVEWSIQDLKSSPVSYLINETDWKWLIIDLNQSTGKLEFFLTESLRIANG